MKNNLERSNVPMTPSRRALGIFWAAACCGLAFCPSTLTAEEGINLDVTTPAITKLKTAMSDREKQIKAWKDKGYLGEDNSGLLATRTMPDIGLKEKKNIQAHLTEENKDRRALYLEILKAHGLKESEANKVMTLAAKKRYTDASVGHWVQSAEDGRWLEKAADN